MNEAMTKYFRTGLIYAMSYPATLSDDEKVYSTVKSLLCDPYFQAIELPHLKNPELRARLKKLLDCSGVTLVFAAQPVLLGGGLNLNALNEGDRQKAVKAMLECVDEAYEMGAESMVFLSGKYDDEDIDLAYEALLKSCQEICRYAASKGNLKICLEVFDYDIDKKSLVGPAPLALDFAKDMSILKNFGLLVDLSHLPLLRETSMECLETLKGYVKNIHIGNAVCDDPAHAAYGDAHPRFGFPNGANDVPELRAFLQALFKTGVIGGDTRPVLSFEVKPWGDEDPDVVLAGCKRALDLAWAQL